MKLKPNKGVEKLPPTQGSIYDYKKSSSPNLCLEKLISFNLKYILYPQPLKLGWKETNDSWSPLLTRNKEAPKEILELLSCNCLLSKCSSNCKRKKNNLECTNFVNVKERREDVRTKSQITSN